MPEPLAQIPVQATVLCSRLANSAANQSDCSLNVTQLALLKAQDQPSLVFFEASVTFNAYPWPAWSSAAGSLVVDQGMSSLMVLNLPKSSQTCSSVLRPPQVFSDLSSLLRPPQIFSRIFNSTQLVSSLLSSLLASSQSTSQSMLCCLCNLWAILCNLWVILCNLWAILCNLWAVLCNLWAILCNLWAILTPNIWSWKRWSNASAVTGDVNKRQVHLTDHQLSFVAHRIHPCFQAMMSDESQQAPHPRL